MRIDSVGTTASFTTTTKLVDAVKGTGSKLRHQGAKTVQQEGVKTDAETSRVNMATMFAVTPAAKLATSQIILRPGVAIAREGMNYFMKETYSGETKQIIDNYAHSKGIYGTENAHSKYFNIKTGANTLDRVSESNINIHKTVKTISPTNTDLRRIVGASIETLDLKSSSRGLSHYQLTGNNLNISGTGGIKAANDYFKMVDSHGRGLDREIRNKIKLGRTQASLVTSLENTYSRWSNPTNFARSGFRLVTMNMQQNETVKGARLAEPLTMFRKVPGKMLNASTNLTLSIVRNNIIRLQTLNRMRVSGGWAYNRGLKAKLSFYRTTKQRVVNAQTREWMKKGIHSLKEMNPLKRHLLRRREELTRRFLLRVFNRNSSHLNSIFAAKDVLLKDKTLGKAGKKLYKTTRNAIIKDALSGTRAGSYALDIARSVSNSRMGKFTKGLKKVTSKVTDTITRPFRWYNNLKRRIKQSILNKLRNTLVGKIALTITTIVKALFGAVAGLLALAMIFVLFVGILADIEHEYSLRDSRNYLDKRSELIFETLEECHDEQIKTLESMQAAYGAADINYANGSKENYKELYCMIRSVSQYNSEIIDSSGTNAEYKAFIKTLYEQTHKVTVASYGYSDETGAPREAAHIMLTIYRDDMGCYEALSDYTGVLATGGSGGVPVPDIAGECANSSWSSVYATVKSLIAESGANYDQGHSQVINVTDASGTSSYTVRQDCSGYVYACIRVYQHMMGLPLTDQGSSHSLGSATDIPGFTKLPFDVNNLQIGDIIVKPGEHTEIFAGSQGGTVYAYSNGCSEDMHVAGATRSVNISSYTYIWRCTGVLGDANSIGSAGAMAGATTTSSGPQKGMVEITGSHLNDIPLSPKNFNEYADYMRNPMYVLGMSNMTGITFNQKTGNQDGYEIPLLASVNAAKQNGMFTSGTFDDSLTTYKVEVKAKGKLKTKEIELPINKNHIPEAGRPSNSADFIRYVLARHGVSFEFYSKDNFMLTHGVEGITGGSYVTTVTTPNKLIAGDIIWYLPVNDPLLVNYNKKTIESFPSTGNDYTNAIIEAKAIPMLYMGNGTVVAFSRDVLAKSVAEYTSSNGAVRTYNLSSLNKDRIIRMYHYPGYTINPVFGYNDFFAGWTDNKISEYLEVENGPQWDKSTGFKYTDHNGNVIDYSQVYHEEFFDTDDNTFTADWHDKELKTEMMNLGLKYYDQYGILPSTLYAHAAAASNFRSTEESLKAFNVFEKIDNSENELETAKYSYDIDGKLITTYQKYKVYSNIEEATLDMFNSYVKNGKSGSFATSFKEQISRYNMAPVSKDIALSVYRDDWESLNRWDSFAVAKNQKQDAVIKDTTELESGKYFLGKQCTQAQYDQLKAKRESLNANLKDFEDWFSGTWGNFIEEGYFTEFRQNSDDVTMFSGYKNDKNKFVLAVAHNELDKIDSILAEQKAYLESEAKKNELKNAENSIKAKIDAAKDELNKALKAVHPAIDVFGNQITFLKEMHPSQAQYDAIKIANQYYYLAYLEAKEFYNNYGNQEGVSDKINISIERMTIKNVNNWLKNVRKNNPSINDSASI